MFIVILLFVVNYVVFFVLSFFLDGPIKVKKWILKLDLLICCLKSIMSAFVFFVLFTITTFHQFYMVFEMIANIFFYPTFGFKSMFP